jgi:uncharacterized protein YaaN involved in tellurite resistance
MLQRAITSKLAVRVSDKQQAHDLGHKAALEAAPFVDELMQTLGACDVIELGEKLGLHLIKTLGL